MGYTPHVVVVGGGITGSGVARDLAMRGLDVTLVERGSLSNGTTGRMHGVLHSGARYADDDPETAAACAAENEILRDVASGCIVEETGLFVKLPGDSPDYFEKKREACHEAGMRVSELPGEQAREREPGLAPAVERALVVPDRTIDPFALTRATAESARDHGATIRTHTEVVDLPGEGAVDGVRVRETVPPGDAPADAETIDADYVVNAAGPWADGIAGLAGLSVPLRRSKGAMLVMADDPVSNVVNRCRPRGEGDILVPFHSHCILGTTDVEIDDPDDFSRPFDAVDGLIDELSTVVPALESGRPLRAYWGVRPLLGGELDLTADGAGDETAADDQHATDASRGFAVVDHERREDCWGITSVVGGKLTTYRLIAERVADHVCEKFGIRRRCETDEEPLPGSERSVPPYWTPARFGIDQRVYRRTVDRLGHHAKDVLGADGPNPVICPCEGVTRAEVRAAVDEAAAGARPLTDVSQRTRIGMGTCQGSHCTVPAANELHPTLPVETVHRERARFLQGRWDGQRYACWGDQLAGIVATYDHLGRTLNLGESVDGAGDRLTGRGGPDRRDATAGEGTADSASDPDGATDPDEEGAAATLDWGAFDQGPLELDVDGGLE